MIDYEKKYNKALEMAKHALDSHKAGVVKTDKVLIESMFPELKESEDEKIRKALIDYFDDAIKADVNPLQSYGTHPNKVIAWLEKQDKHPNNEEAEKEKYDYVSCQSLYCKGSFNEFKEGESYWLEYVGNDNYIGRSDNILNQKFHITPRQLYTWLDPRCGYIQCENDTDENSTPRECGKSEDEVIRNCIGMCLTDASERRFKDYNTSLKECLDWLEKQGNSNSQNWKPSKEQINALEHFVRSIAESGYASPYDDNTKLLKSLINDLHKLEKQKDINALIQQAYKQGYTEGQRIERKHWLEKQDEQKPILDFKASNWYVSKVDGKIHDLTYNPADKIKPKFKVGDWILYSGDHYEGVRHITKIDENGYYIERNGLPHGIIPFNHEICMRLWTIQDAKDGDVLASNNSIFIFQEEYIAEKPIAYCGLMNGIFIKGEDACWTNEKCHPATNEQCETLFKAMHEAGYEWDAEKKELNKINSYCKENCKGYQETGKCFADGGCDAKHKAEQESIAWTDDDEENLNGVIGVIEHREITAVSEQYKDILYTYTCWLKSLKDRVQPQSKTTWSDED